MISIFLCRAQEPPLVAPEEALDIAQALTKISPPAVVQNITNQPAAAPIPPTAHGQPPLGSRPAAAQQALRKTKEEIAAKSEVKDAANKAINQRRDEETQRIARLKEKLLKLQEEKALAIKAAKEPATLWRHNSELLRAMSIILWNSGLEGSPQTVVDRLKARDDQGRDWVTKYNLTGEKIAYFVETTVRLYLPAYLSLQE